MKPLGNQHIDELCGTIDTGCQRMAIGANTLERYSQKLPSGLQVHLVPQQHHFRSVNGKTTTEHIASLPSSLGRKGGFLRPAVFEGPESREAPFLISLPFLMFCQATLIPDQEIGLKAVFKKLGFEVQCHLGPTGALRLPLGQFSNVQMQSLLEAQEHFQHGSEFEVLKVSAHPSSTTSPPSTSTSHGVEQQEESHHANYTGADSLGKVDAEGVPAHVQDDRLGSPDGHAAGEDRRYDNQDDGGQHQRQQSEVLYNSRGVRADQRREELDGDGLRGDALAGGREVPDGGSLSPGGTCTTMQPRTLVSAPCDSSTGGQLHEAVLAVPEESPSTVPVLHVDEKATSTGALPQGEPLPPSELQFRAGTSHSVCPRQGGQDGQQRLRQHQEVCHLREGPEQRADGARTSDASGEGGRAREEGMGQPRATNTTGMQGMEEERCTGGERSVGGIAIATQSEQAMSKHVVRQIESTLADQERMWNTIMSLLREPNSTEGQEVLSLATEGSNRDRRHLAHLLQLTEKQARTVAEVYNPNRFGSRAEGQGMIPGSAFDLVLGHDLLRPRVRQEVRDYLKTNHPGLTIISPPCTMFSALQNLGWSRWSDPEKQQQRARKMVEARMLLNFAVEICQLVQSYGGYFLFEHPWTSKAWDEPRLQRLLRRDDSLVARSDQCMFNLKSARGIRHKKPTGWLTNHPGIAKALEVKCDKTHEHELILGSGPGGSKSKLAQEYPDELVDTVLKSYRATVTELYDLEKLQKENAVIDEIFHEHFHSEAGSPAPPEGLHRPFEDDEELDAGDGGVIRCLSREKPLSLEQLVRRAHCGLGHCSNDKLARILRDAKAAPEAIEIAKKLQCSVCEKHQHVMPARQAAPPRELHANQVLGVDTVWLPGIQPGGKLRMAINMVDWATRFQLVIPIRDHTPSSARRAFHQWVRIFGPPERVYVDLGKEFRGAFSEGMEVDSIFLDPGSLEMPTQRSITERAGRTFKEILSKTLMDVACRDWEHWAEAVDVVTSTVNRLTNKSGYSPVQRMLGYTPRVPGGLMTGGANDLSTSSRALVGDLQVQRAVQLRQAAAIAFHQADASQALRNAVRAGPRKWADYQVGQMVYYWKKGMERAKKDSPAFWHGPAKVILINMPNTVWVSHQGRVVKAAPEQLRPASDEEKFTLTDCMD